MQCIFLGTDSGLNSVWSHPSILIWCTGVLGSGASNVCFFLSVTQPHRELMPPALISQSEEGDWLFNCSCFFKILVFFWLYSSNGKLPWQVKNHLLRFLLCFWCVMAWARVSLDEGLRPSDAASCHATVYDLEWDPKLLGFIFFVLKMRGMNLLMKGCFSSQRHDDEMLCFSIVHWNFSPRKRAFGKYIMRLLGPHGGGGEPCESRPGHSLRDQLVLEFRGTHKSVTSHTRMRGREGQGDI